jgi:1,2-diacylglycerol 3-alpha-glucosyltransferase
MNIIMFTNTFSPHIGEVAHSVSWLAESLRSAGHGVLVVAPEFPGSTEDEPGVVRIPAMQNFAGSDFSVPIPLTRSLHETTAAFAPDVVHSHHPFLLGDTALRVAASFDLPIVYTYHTRYELYGHYVAQDAPVLQRLVLSLALGYCDLCNAVIAPSRSMAGFLVEHGVKRPTTAIPTGIEIGRFDSGDGHAARVAAGLPDKAFVVGHVGRLAPEKNLDFLVEAISRFLVLHTNAHFLVVGDGPMRQRLKQLFADRGLAERVHLPGAIEGDRLADMYAAMDVFVFSSHSETQGLVLAEAMAAGVPVIALDAFGAREVVRDGLNGRLLPSNAPADQFAEAVCWFASRNSRERRNLRKAAHRTSNLFTREKATRRVLDLYRSLVPRPMTRSVDTSLWMTTVRRLEQEWRILRNVAHAVGDAVLTHEPTEAIPSPEHQSTVASP